MKEPLIDLKPDVKKVVIKKEDTDAVQTQETNDSDAIVEESKDSGNSEEVVEEVRASDEEVASPLTVIAMLLSKSPKTVATAKKWLKKYGPPTKK
jgi:hypothetical protein